MTNAPPLTELSAETGLSLSKLKKGFKIVFGKTAYACLHEDRMERAHSLLSERRLNVSQVAWEIGYINVGHFSTAFRKQFGIRPKEFQLNFT
jgi:AraC-like DNA-binding protein